MSGASGYVLVEDGEVAEGYEQVELQIPASFLLLRDRQPCLVAVDAEACAVCG